MVATTAKKMKTKMMMVTNDVIKLCYESMSRCGYDQN